jgi:peptide/nickel transport system permease protein
MLAYILRRLFLMIPVLFGVSTALFVLMRVVPGDVARTILGQNATPEAIGALRHQMGLDQSIGGQYVDWLWGLVRGDLGESLRSGFPVSTLIGQRFPATLELTAAAMAISLVTAIPLGILAAVKRGSWIDHVTAVIGLVGLSIPSFWLGTLLILFVALKLRWLPPFGYTPFFDDPLQNLRNLALPALTLGFSMTAVVMRMTRSSMVEVLGEEFVKTARAKGLIERRVLYGHALKNALIPVLTVIGLQTGFLFAGAVIIENLFAWPGIGRLTLDGVFQRDYPVVQGSVLFVALLFVLINLVVDVLYSYLDPRIHYR